MRPHWSVLGFLVFWFLALAFGAGRAIGPVADGALREWENVVIPVGMMLLGWAIVMGGFLPEAHRTRRLLTEAVAAPELR